MRVIEINRPHAHTRARRGNNDAIDAEAAARKVLVGECASTPKDTTAVVEAIRQLHLARCSAVQARTSAPNQLAELMITAASPVRESLTARTLAGKAGQAPRWRPDATRLAEPTNPARMALRSLARRIQTLGAQIATLHAQLSGLLTRTVPRTLELPGIGVVNAARMLIAAGAEHRPVRQRGRVRAPVRPRTDPRLIRQDPTPPAQIRRQPRRQQRPTQAVVVRPRCSPRTRDYLKRRTSEGKSNKEIIRCLKRYVVPEVYYTLRADLKSWSNHLTPYSNVPGLELLAKSRIRIVTTEPEPSTSNPAMTTEALTA